MAKKSPQTPLSESGELKIKRVPHFGKKGLRGIFLSMEFFIILRMVKFLDFCHTKLLSKIAFS
jgi:hypothetical protein